MSRFKLVHQSEQFCGEHRCWKAVEWYARKNDDGSERSVAKGTLWIFEPSSWSNAEINERKWKWIQWVGVKGVLVAFADYVPVSDSQIIWCCGTRWVKWAPKIQDVQNGAARGSGSERKMNAATEGSKWATNVNAVKWKWRELRTKHLQVAEDRRRKLLFGCFVIE